MVCSIIGGYLCFGEMYLTSVLKMEVIHSSKMFLSTCKTALCCNAEDMNPHFYYHEHLIITYMLSLTLHSYLRNELRN
jgi:hypothetical protein